MRKVYDLSERFEGTGEATVQPVLLWGANGRPLRESFSKTASLANDYIKSVTPVPGKTIVLVLAMGAYETYDLNRNGDGWTEQVYKAGVLPTCGHDGCRTTEGWISQAETLPNHYKSFEEFGKNYMHHQNKDPAKAVGDVIKAFWNPYMHRVELLVGIDDKKAPEIVQRIAAHEFPAVSMGCRIKYDVCTECGHRAPTRDQYCDHLKYFLRQMLPSGLRAGALNPSPRFFDISWVLKPADQTGFMMKKVAYVYELRSSAAQGEDEDARDAKVAALRKIADMDKIVRGIPVDYKTSPLSAIEGGMFEQFRSKTMPNIVKQMPVMDDATLNELSKKPITEVLSTLHAAGVVLTSAEFVKLMLAKMAPGTKIPEEALDTITKLQSNIFDYFQENPQLLDEAMESGIFDINAAKVKPAIAGIAEKYLEKRSTITDYLQRSMMPDHMAIHDNPRSDVLHVVDPGTGQRMATNRDAAIDAHDRIARREMAKMVGGAAALAGAYKVVSSGIGPTLRPLAMAGTALAAGHMLRPNYGPQYQTEEGMPVSAYTELHKEASAGDSVGLPLLGTLGLVTALGHDYESRLRRGMPVHDKHDSMIRQGLDAAGDAAYTHPALSTLGSLAAYGIIKNKLASDVYTAAPMTLDRLAEKLGEIILP